MGAEQFGRELFGVRQLQAVEALEFEADLL